MIKIIFIFILFIFVNIIINIKENYIYFLKKERKGD